MFIPTKNRKLIHQYLFNKGVLVVKKDFNLAKNPDIPVPNLQVIKAMQSLVSRKLVTEQFNWQVYYYFLTEEGIAYLRSYLNIPESVVPDTVAKATMPTAVSGRSREESMAGSGSGSSFHGRRGPAPGGAPKSAGTHEFKPRFAGH